MRSEWINTHNFIEQQQQQIFSPKTMGSTIAPQQTNQGCSHVIFNYTLNYSKKKSIPVMTRMLDKLFEFSLVIE